MQRRSARLLSLAWLGWVMHAAVTQLIQHFPPAGTRPNNDAYWTYLPNAQKLLEHPWAFLTTDPASYHVAPLGYIWAAVWGVDPARIQLANSVLFIFCVLMVWRCANLLGGFFAGILATYLLVRLPQFISYIPQVLTESIYLFGFVLCLFASIEYFLGRRRSNLMLALASSGLTITLLSRPVLQIFTLLALALTIGCSIYSRNKKSTSSINVYQLNSKLSLALLTALILPAAVGLKNGLYFNVWGLGTGSGSGLYYGVNPLKMGHEPVYSGFNYDAHIVPKAVIPYFSDGPLSREADQLNTRVAIELVKNTSLSDNFTFFLQKFKSWMLYSTPELHMYQKLRKLRYFEWISILLAAAFLVSRSRGSHDRSMPELPGAIGREKEKLVILGTLLLLTIGMAAQLTPVLYNTRYNLFFLDPGLILLCAASIGIILQLSGIIPVKWGIPEKISATSSAKLLAKLAILGFLLAWLPNALTKHAIRNETWQMDPRRPGPVEAVLNQKNMGKPHAVHATDLGDGKWRIDGNASTLFIPLQIEDPQNISPSEILDAVWLLHLSVTAPDKPPRSCRQALMTVSNAHTSQDWYEPDALLPLKLDGSMHTYAFHGNDHLRPAASGELGIHFSCSPGTVVHWGGAELLKSRLAEAARDFLQQGKPISPYYHAPR